MCLVLGLATDKLQLKGQNLGRVFNFRSGCVHAMRLFCYRVKLPNLKLKTRPKQLLGPLPLDIALPALALVPALASVVNYDYK
jgi:hypothetical protein